MKYVSTRNNRVKVNSADAIAHGISGEGGLFVPEELPLLDSKDFENLAKLDYIGRAKYILKYFLLNSGIKLTIGVNNCLLSSVSFCLL